MFFSKKFQELKVYEWDQETVTAGDYTCEMEIPNTMFQKFCEQEAGNIPAGRSKGDALKEYFLKHLPDIFYSDWRSK
jgi:hypothetical protein